MKRTLRLITGAALLTAAISLQPTARADSTVATTTTSDGTVSEFTPGGSTIVLQGDSGSPLRYSYSKSTTIVDESGNPVDVSVVKSGVPVEVSYDRDGDGMIARKIIVRHHEHATDAPAAVSEKTTTTTTTTDGKDHDHDHDH